MSSRRLLHRLRTGGALVVLMGALVSAAGTPAQAEVRAAAPQGKVDPVPYRTYHDGPYSRYAFSSPHGDLRCSIATYEDSRPWGCYAVKHTWRDPKLPPESYSTGCGRSRLKGAIFAEYPGGSFVERCKDTDPEATRKGKILPRGRSISVHGVTCTSTVLHGRDAMRCTAPKSTRLLVSRTSLTFAQPKR